MHYSIKLFTIYALSLKFFSFMLWLFHDLNWVRDAGRCENFYAFTFWQNSYWCLKLLKPVALLVYYRQTLAIVSKLGLLLNIVKIEQLSNFNTSTKLVGFFPSVIICYSSFLYPAAHASIFVKNSLVIRFSVWKSRLNLR